MTDNNTPITTEDISKRLVTVEEHMETTKGQLSNMTQILEKLEPKPIVKTEPIPTKTDIEPVFESLYETAKESFKKLDTEADLSKLDKIDISAQHKIQVLKAFEQSVERNSKLIEEIAVLKKETQPGAQAKPDSTSGTPPTDVTPPKPTGLTGAQYLEQSKIDIQAMKEQI